jgi:hypothetical protein
MIVALHLFQRIDSLCLQHLLLSLALPLSHCIATVHMVTVRRKHMQQSVSILIKNQGGAQMLLADHSTFFIWLHIVLHDIMATLTANVTIALGYLLLLMIKLASNQHCLNLNCTHELELLTLQIALTMCIDYKVMNVVIVPV